MWAPPSSLVNVAPPESLAGACAPAAAWRGERMPSGAHGCGWCPRCLVLPVLCPRMQLKDRTGVRTAWRLCLPDTQSVLLCACPPAHHRLTWQSPRSCSQPSLGGIPSKAPAPVWDHGLCAFCPGGSWGPLSPCTESALFCDVTGWGSLPPPGTDLGRWGLRSPRTWSALSVSSFVSKSGGRCSLAFLFPACSCGELSFSGGE